MEFSRSSGPGGQNVNKVNTKVDLWVSVWALRGLPPDAIDRLRTLAGSRLTTADEIHIAADEYRSQQANRASALGRLRDLLLQAKQRPRRRRPTRPGAASRQARLDEKRRRSQIKSSRRDRNSSE
jgi:ribosome-associated protein